MYSILENITEWEKSHRYVHALIQEFKDDLCKNKDTTLRQKIWAYKRGFRSSKILMYGLNAENYADYLSDFDYHRLQPINGKFRRWIDDKLTMKYILQPFDDHLPKYFYQLENDKVGARITRLTDCPNQYTDDAEGIVRLLKAEKRLAAKLIEGAFGSGFYRITYLEGNYYVNDRLMHENEMVDFFEILNGYILTEYISAHTDLGKICNDNGSSLRILTIKDSGTKPQIAGSFIRFSTEKSGSVDNISAGGVGAFVDINDGSYKNGRMLVKDEWVECQLHPNTGVVMEGTLPFWDQITETVLAICNYIPQIRFMGFDIIITDDGFKIIEINSQPAMALHNYYCPIHKDDKLKDFFENILREKRK